MDRFEDHFSPAAANYARYRPRYPDALFEFLAAAAPGHGLVWDAGTGNGQAVVQLRRHFSRVVATDASLEQLSQAPEIEGVEYRNEAAEATSLGDRSVDLVTAAAAAHWFDHDRFHAEVERVLRPPGIVAVWAYHLPSVSSTIDPLVEEYSAEILAGYWPERAAHVLNRYESLPFPFVEIEAPELYVETDWNLMEFGGFLRSWSGGLAYRERTGKDPLERIGARLWSGWGDPLESRRVRSRIFARVGRVAAGEDR